MIKKFKLEVLCGNELKEVRAEDDFRISCNGFTSSSYMDKRIYSYISFALNKTFKNYNCFYILNCLKNQFKNNDSTIFKIITKLELDIEALPDKVFEHYLNEIPETNNVYDIGILWSAKSLYDFPEVKKIVNKTVQDILQYINNKTIKVKMNSYDNNLELLFNILNINGRQKEFETLKLDMNVHFVHDLFETIHNMYGTNSSFIFDVYFKNNEIPKLEKNSIVIFNTANRFELLEILKEKKYKDKNELMNSICSIINKNKLSLEDFDFIKQKEFILNVLKNAIKSKQKGINILFYGTPGSGKTELAKTLIKELNVVGYEIPTPKIDLKSDTILDAKESRPRLIDPDFNNESRARKTKLLLISELVKSSEGIILFDEAEDFFRNNSINLSNQSKYSVNEILENNPVPIIWTTNDIHCMEESYLRRFNYILEMNEIPAKHLEKIINNVAEKNKIKLNEVAKNIILSRKPSIGVIDKALKTYKLSKSNKKEELNTLLLDMINNTRFQQNIHKTKLNKNKFLPELLNTSEDLDKITNMIVKSGVLNFSILSYGCSGSSKTSFARYLAEKLGIEVIYKNYTELSSCWVGETEKQIQELFDKATQQKAMIILDEADVLLQDRNNATHSWEVSTTEALLTAMEDHEYPFIMTTNLFDNIDSAAMRRFDFKIKHNYMTEEQVKLALKYFFDLDVNYNTHLKQLTPGDCVSVKKQIRFLPDITEKEILEKLELECKNKKDYSKTIGF